MGNYTGAKEAYALARQGKYELLRGCKISLNFSWGEVFVNRTEEEIRACPEFVFKNAVEQAKRLEAVRHVLGKPLRVSSWYRPNSKNHKTGLATDFNGTYTSHVATWNAAIRCGWAGGMGIAAKGHKPRLHLDSRYSESGQPLNREWYYLNGVAVNTPKPNRALIR